MKTSLSSHVNNAISSKLWYYIENSLVIGLLFYCIKSLVEYDNFYYQTWKNAAASKAVLAFTAIIFVIRKVKLFNWQSLVASLVFCAVFWERMRFWRDSEDIWSAVKPQMIAEWLTLMIIIDMLLYKNINNLFKGINYLLLLYIAMTLGMIWRRHDRMDPIILIFPMFLFSLVKIDEEKKEWFMCRFIDGWFVSFIFFTIKSFKENPYDGYRYYGCFLNIGQFGIFIVCCFVTAVIALYFIKDKYGRNSFFYYFGLIWMIAIICMAYLIDTRTIMIGFLFCIICIYIYVRKDTHPKMLIKRWACVASFAIASILLLIISIKLCTNISDEWLENNRIGGLAFIAHAAEKLHNASRYSALSPINNKMIGILDVLSSYRLTIIENYIPFFNFDGNGTIGLEIAELGGYWAYGAHNTYIQLLIEYGYISFIEIILLIMSSINICKNVFLYHQKKATDLLAFLWLSAMIGVWFGESNTFFYPISFFGYMFISGCLSYQPNQRVKTIT